VHFGVALLLGLAAAGLGGELFIRGAVGIARAARLTTAIIGLTVAAFATSSPELSVAVNSALAGTPAISLGDALGSNVVNVALVLALATVIAPIKSGKGSLRRDFPVAVATAPVITLLAWDGRLSRADGLVMLSIFAVWLTLVVAEGWRTRRAFQPAKGAASRLLTAGGLSVAGLLLLVAAGRLIVLGAQGVGAVLGLAPFTVGATMVSVGTSVPELATTLAAQLRGHSDISLGNILGSNIFNAFFIVSVAAVIHPIAVNWHGVALGLGFGIAAMVFALPRRTIIGRSRGLLLLALYAIYLLTILRVD
jgi:cation:H+ antiporter